jgi:hypothetical protein
MEFTSITEYFYKISSRLLVVLLVPILFFIYVYLQPVLVPTDLQQTPDRFAVVAGGMLLVWIASFIFFNKKIKSIRNGQGLREKLEKYFRLTIVRYTFFSFCSLLLAIGFFLTRNDVFAVVFILQLAVAGVVWPFSSKVSNDLKLRGAEREMVYYKKDTLN